MYFSIRQKAKKDFFKKATKNGIMPHKELLKLLRPFLTNKGSFSERQISMEIEDDE